MRFLPPDAEQLRVCRIAGRRVFHAPAPAAQSRSASRGAGPVLTVIVLSYGIHITVVSYALYVLRQIVIVEPSPPGLDQPSPADVDRRGAEWARRQSSPGCTHLVFATRSILARCRCSAGGRRFRRGLLAFSFLGSRRHHRRRRRS